jgi:hypothetical protein
MEGTSVTIRFSVPASVELEEANRFRERFLQLEAQAVNFTLLADRPRISVASQYYELAAETQAHHTLILQYQIQHHLLSVQNLEHVLQHHLSGSSPIPCTIKKQNVIL